MTGDHKILGAFFCKCSVFLSFLLKYFPKCLFHMDNHINFKVKLYIRIHKQKKHLVFLGSWFEFLIFQIYFTKSKTQTDDRFSCYYNSSVESLWLSALPVQFFLAELSGGFSEVMNIYLNVSTSEIRPKLCKSNHICHQGNCINQTPCQSINISQEEDRT